MTSLIRVIAIAIGLAMDATSVSAVAGLRSRMIRFRDALKAGIVFGVFQTFMPVIGFAIGHAAQKHIASISSYIAFVLLVAIGIKMVFEALHENHERENMLSWKTLVSLGVATSIDALVVGTTLDLIKLPLVLSVVIIGCVTCVLCVAAYMGGTHLGKFFGQKIEIVGGIVLVVIGFTFLFS